MIGSYLNSLYKNCKSLSVTTDYDAAITEAFFMDQISQFMQEQAIKDEEALLFFLAHKKFSELEPHFERSGFLKIFYLVNSLGEYVPTKENTDELGRFKYSASVQAQTDTQNQVWDLMAASVDKYNLLHQSFQIKPRKSYFFLSHDIDSLYGSLLQDGLWALKSKRPDILLTLFLNTLVSKPHWFNIDKIMKLESEYDFKSTFYWLVNKGKIDQRQTNSDYMISSAKLKRTIGLVKEKGFENGLHKSISAESFSSELSKLPIPVSGNRYHYLKFQLPKAYSELEKSGLLLDASLGFAEHVGFRNNYGYPFSPYNPETGTHYSFTEVPLTVMDGTFQRYLKLPVDQTAKTVVDFLGKNKENALVSVLWHNTFFTNYKYKGYKEEYVKILQYFYEEKFNNINQSEIRKLFAWKK